MLQQQPSEFQDKLRQLASRNAFWSESSIEVEKLEQTKIVLGLIAAGFNSPGKMSPKLIVRMLPTNDGTTKLDTTIQARFQLIAAHYFLLLFSIVAIVRFTFFHAPFSQLLYGLVFIIATPYCANWYQNMTSIRLKKEFEDFIRKDVKQVN